MKKNLFTIIFISISIITGAQNTMEPPPPPKFSKQTDTTGVFDRVEKEASFPGGIENWIEYIKANFKVDSITDIIWKELPDKAKKKKGVIQITAIVQFIVCTDGTVCNVKTVNKVPDAFKTEAERLIIESKLWEPAEQNGRKVKAFRKQPITIQIPIE